MTLPERFTPHTVTVRAYRSGGGMGGGHGAPRGIRAWVVDEQKVVLSVDGKEVVSNTQVSIDVGELVPIDSLVTVWQGQPGERESMVLAVSVFRHDRLPSFRTLHLK